MMWEQYIENISVKYKDGIKEYYHRCGTILAITYVLGSTDLHCENIIAYKEYPIVIDSETILTGIVKPFTVRNPSGKVNSSPDILQRSVLGIGMLPTYKQIGSDRIVEFGGFSGYVREQKNLPMYGSEHYDIAQYSEELVKGFSEAYDLMYVHKNDIIMPNEFKSFSQCTCRFLVRNTNVYSAIIEQLDRTNTEAKREVIISKLKNAYTKYALPELLENLLIIYNEERLALLNNDIPIFYVKNSEKHLYSHKALINATCKPIYKEYLLQSPFDRAVSTLMLLNKKDKELQIDLIHSSIYTYRARKENNKIIRYPKKEINIIERIDQEKILSTAEIIAYNIRSKQLASTCYPEWLIYQKDSSASYCGVSAIGLPMYAGYAGLVIYFAALGCVKLNMNKNDKYESEEIIKYALSIYDILMLNYYDEKKGGSLLHNRLLGWVNGAGGILVLMCDLLTYISQGQLRSNVIDEFYNKIKNDIHCLLIYILENDISTGMSDVMTGTAGFLCALDRADNIVEKSLLSELSKKYGSILLGERTEWHSKLLWFGDYEGRPLTGYGHGMSGMATACAVTYCYTHDVKYLNAMYQALEYEELNYSYDEKAWPDYRQDAKEIAEKESSRKKHYMYGWCNGAPGIGLAQLKIVDLLKSTI